MLFLPAEDDFDLGKASSQREDLKNLRLAQNSARLLCSKKRTRDTQSFVDSFREATTCLWI